MSTESMSTDRVPVRGSLRLTGKGHPPVEKPVVHSISYVNDANYQGMEDNDVRGFLDGVFLYGWNQPGQGWVRLGRIGWLHGYGEYELFRFLQRWDKIEKVEGASVTEAELVIETGPKAPNQAVSLALYAVHTNWDPGLGGIDKDNVSPPAQGEVWWNDRAHQSASWGLPGCSYPSADPHRGDIHPMPLAIVDLPTTGGKLRFSTPALTAYINDRVCQGEPLLFLFKLTDVHEDVRETLVHMWSGNEGDSRAQGRKPRLTLGWTSQEGHGTTDVPVLLEHGRSVVLPPLEVSGPSAMLDFEVEPESPRPLIYVRRKEDEPWVLQHGVGVLGPGPIEVRLSALCDPVVYGSTFEADLRDTWVQTGPPEAQDVTCTFLSPSGREHRVRVAYAGSFTWELRFRPTEVGRWTYRWNHAFAEPVYESKVEPFDVVVETTDQIARLLAAFEDRMAQATKRERKKDPVLKEEMARIIRAVMNVMDPEMFHDVEGRAIRERLRAIRGLFGDTVPDPIPLERAEKRSWDLGVLKPTMGRD